MGSMIPDPELLPNHFHHARRGPDIAPEAKCHRSSCQQGGQLRHLFGAQLRLSAWRGLMQGL